MINKFVLSMASLRLFSGCLEITAALLMLKWNQVEKSLLINAGLSVFGPFVLLMTMTLGLMGIADKISFGKMAWVLIGVGCIFMGILKK